MHLSASAQRAAHRAIVAEALRRTGGVDHIPEIVTHDVPSASPVAYRTRARFHAASTRGRVDVGYLAEGSRSLTPIDRCAVLVPALDALLADLPAVLAGATGSGEISVARGAGGKPVVDIAWRGSIPEVVWSRLDARATSSWAGARLWLDGAKEPASFGDPRPVITAADGLPLVVGAGGFAQPSDEAGAVLARVTASLVRKSGDAIGTIVELYAGSGTLSILLAPLAKRFVAVESHDESARAARQNLASRNLGGKVVCADAGAHDPGRADVVVLDPPRTGAKQAADLILLSSSRAVVYVACDPTTMARDVAVLTGRGFTLTDVETVEIFPQTSHTETIVRLVRGKR